MTPAERAGRRLWIGIPGDRMDGATRRLLEEVRPGGVVLLGRNLPEPGRAAELIRNLRGLLGVGLHVAVDQEGGAVVRLEEPLTVFPGNMALGAASMREPSLGEHLAERQGEVMGAELRELGVDVVLAPVLDLATGPNPAVGARSFGAHAGLAARLGRALVAGLRRGGACAVAKHAPGLGAAREDPHRELSRAEGPEDLGPHLEPFRAAVGAEVPALMTTHLLAPGLDPGAPATFSRAVVQGTLREGLGFRGVVLTDDLAMAGARAPEGDAVAAACAAGHDVLLLCSGTGAQKQAAARLRAGLTRGAAWYGEPRLVDARLDRLQPPRPGAHPGRRAARLLADAIAGRGVTVLRDPQGLLPLRADQQVVAALPRPAAASAVEDVLRGTDPGLLAGRLPGGAELVPLPPGPGPAVARQVLERARRAPRLLVGLAGALRDPGQAACARALAAGHPACIFLLLQDPFDIRVVPDDGRAAVVTAYGFREVHLEALARVLSGAAEPYGRAPAPLEHGTKT